jgi:hypothetical protein
MGERTVEPTEDSAAEAAGTASRRRLRPWIRLVVKLAIAALILFLIARSGLIHVRDFEHAAARWPLLLAALCALLLAPPLTSLRWGILLRAHDIHVPFRRLLSLTMTGLFFTIVAPGGMGGDAVRAVYLVRGQERRAEAATTVFLDRFLALVTLLFVGGVVLAFNARMLWNAELDRLGLFGMPGGRVVILGAALAGCVVLAFVVLASSRRVQRSALLISFWQHLPLGRKLGKVFAAVHHYRDRPYAVLAAFAVSIIAQVPQYAMYYLCARALGVDIRVWHCALIVPPAVLIRMVPLAPAGTGQGAAAMGILFPLVGISRGAAIGALGDGMFALAYLLGGPFFLLSRSQARPAGATTGEPESDPAAPA